MEEGYQGTVSIDLVAGDCVVVMQSMAPESIDVVTTSFPYNLGVKYASGYNDSIPRSQYLDQCVAWMGGIKRVLAYKGSFFLNMGGKPTDPWPPFEVIAVAKLQGWHLQNIFYWIKSIAINGAPAVGHAKPINSPRFVTDVVEHVFHLTKTGDVELDKLAIGVPYAVKANMDRDTRGKNGDIRDPGNAWFIPQDALPLSEHDAAWLALFVDTEGSIVCTKSARPNRPSDAYTWVVGLYNTHLPLINRARDLIASFSKAPPVYEREPSDGVVKGNKTGYELKVSNKLATAILARLYPYLIVKQRQALCALYLDSLVDAENRRAVSAAVLEVRDRVCAAVRALNGADSDAVDLSWIPNPTEPGNNAWFTPYKTIQSRDDDRPHPASFPPALAERCMKVHGLSRIKMTMDPFSGLGSSAQAAKHLGLAHIGIELGKDDTEMAKKLLLEAPGPDGPPDPPCKACGGTLKNSKGQPCTPCQSKLPSKLFAHIPERVCSGCGGAVYAAPGGALCDRRHGGADVDAGSPEGQAAVAEANGANPRRPKGHVPDPPMIPGRFCVTCKLPVHRTTSGDLCMNGHLDGPVPSDGPEEDEGAPPIPKTGTKRKPAKSRMPTLGTPIGAPLAPPAPPRKIGLMDGFK